MKSSVQFLMSIAILCAGFSARATVPMPLWEAMDRAAQSNPAIKSQQVEVDRQAVEQQIAHSQHLPKIDLNASYTRSAFPAFVTPIRAPGVFPPMDRDIANIGLALTLPLYSGGKLVAGEALAAHNREASEQALRSSGQDLLFNVAATYTKALHFRHLGRVLDARVKALQREQDDIGLRIEQGRAARLELIRLQTQLSQARYDETSIVQGEKDALSLLTALLGESGAAPTLSELETTSPILPATAQEAIGRAFQRRPDMLRLDAMGKAAEQKVAIARGDRLPQINLVARAQDSAGGNWKGYDDWQMGVQLSLPLFDGDIRKGRVEQAALEQRQSTLQQEDARNRVTSEVEQAFGALSESRAKLAVATQGEREANEALRIETLRYHSGENTITDLLGAESALWAATANRLQAGYDITVSQARLLRAIGELTADSFRPAGPGKVSDTGHSTSEINPRSLSQYLAWHRHATACAGVADLHKAKVDDSPRHGLTANDSPGLSIQQGARL